MRRSCLLALALAALSSGCASFNSRGHDPRAGGARQWKNAFADAALAPETVIPLALATVVALTGCDRSLSEWAGERTPVFGSRENADRLSDDLAGATRFASVATAVLVPGKGGGSLRTKSTCIALGIAARGANDMSTGALKKNARRARPDDSDRMSFPSAHSSDTAVNATLAARNIELLPLPGHWRTGLRGGMLALAAGAAWARVEARKHYATDVLAGAALGSFFGNLLCNAWLPVDCSVSLQPLDESAAFVLRLAF